jgi:septal ring factor EnvC (AmiA/AmiB activator)
MYKFFTLEFFNSIESLNKVLPSSELDAVTKQMEEEERKKEELKRQEEDRKKAEEARLKRRDKRERVIDELIQTEKDYLNGLHLCIETFISPTGEKVTYIQLKLGHI